MLWDIIRDFFVQYIWGGYLSNGEHVTTFSGLGNFYDSSGSFDESLIVDNDFFVMKFQMFDGNYFTYGLGDWLSTTSTIIVLILMCIFLYVFIRWAFRLTAGLFQGR